MTVVWITGMAGTLGSLLTDFFVRKGFTVKGNDIIRKEEAWKLNDVRDNFKYFWKSSEDIEREEIEDVDIIFDCAIGFADRPFAISSPIKAFYDNISPSFFLLEKVRRLEKKPHIVYPSSFNVFYGHGEMTVSEKTQKYPSTLYGWTKSVVEDLYRTYGLAYNIPYTITRVGSAFGPKGRGDELPHKIILYILNGKKTFYLRSPKSKRLWTYAKDVLNFYEKFINEYREFDKEIFHLAGNVGDRIIENIELFNIIRNEMKSNIEAEYGEYEVGELINNKPISFQIDSEYTREKLNWRPQYTLEVGLRETIEWFSRKWWRYSIL